MEKYLVIVNRKYLVNVEAASHGGAEHRVLDLVYGITGAQAFSKKDMSTEFFRDYAINCETVSFNWLVEQSKAFKESQIYEAECRKALNDNNSKISQLLKQIEALKASNDILHSNITECENERLFFNIKEDNP